MYALDHAIAFGMIKDGAAEGLPDDWPSIQAKIMAADILVLGTPIWLGAKSSVASLVIERMYAYSGDRNEQGQYLYYGKTAGCVITGNEDGIKHCARDILYSHAAHRVHDPAAGGLRLDRRGRARARATATRPGRARPSATARHRSASTTTSRTATPPS